MKPRILVTREVFDETLAFLGQHCEVESNQPDTPFDPDTLARKLADFVDAVASKRAPMVTGEDGRRALALAQQITDRMTAADVR